MPYKLEIYKSDDKCFTVGLADQLLKIEWNDITQINVFKIDQLTVDCIAMELFFNNEVITINEEIPGWDEFITGLEKVFPNIPDDWWQKVVHPAFATNFTTIYKK